VYGKELKGFLRVVSYSHSHIRDYATVARPLHKMIHSNERNRKLVWTPEGRESFALSKKAINDCPTLVFTKDDRPVYLHTDAIDYGLAGHLFQVIEGKETPCRIQQHDAERP
jgi:hypothetical protein